MTVTLWELKNKHTEIAQSLDENIRQIKAGYIVGREVWNVTFTVWRRWFHSVNVAVIEYCDGSIEIIRDGNIVITFVLEVA